MKAQLDETKHELDTTKDALERSKASVTAIEEKSAALAKALTKAVGEKSSLEQTNASLLREIGAIKNELAGAAEGVKSMTAKRDALQAELTAANKAFTRKIDQLQLPAEPDVSQEI